MAKDKNKTECTIVVPAYQEGGNLKALTERVFAALKEADGMDAVSEMIIVDDNSQDESEAVVAELAKRGYAVRIIVRKTERGLSSAVMRGFDEAAGTVLLCMDGDLQHPPEKVPALLAALRDGAEFVIGTRYGAGVEIDENWPMHRRVISSVSRMMAQPLTPLSDPMSGFFGVQRAVYQRGVVKKTLSPLGFKIAMEVFVKTEVNPARVAEVPFSFGVRTVGESKLTGKVIIHYLLHLWDLYKFKFGAAQLFVMFVLVLMFFWLFWCTIQSFL